MLSILVHELPESRLHHGTIRTQVIRSSRSVAAKLDLFLLRILILLLLGLLKRICGLFLFLCLKSLLVFEILPQLFDVRIDQRIKVYVIISQGVLALLLHSQKLFFDCPFLKLVANFDEDSLLFRESDLSVQFDDNVVFL